MTSYVCVRTKDHSEFPDLHLIASIGHRKVDSQLRNYEGGSLESNHNTFLLIIGGHCFLGHGDLQRRIIGNGSR